ncbi:hypothetical protein ACFUNF_21115 [Streptomyces sp. NPDC057291]|uniref:hypothetical protein n=1 Tax=Streptomyces sp. NPDC057291 TaxID=3346087 RepID=UPI00362C3FB9
MRLPEVFQAQHQLDRLVRHHHHRLRQALDLARKSIEEWSAFGMPIDLALEWARRLDLIETHPVGRKIPLEDRCRLAAFPETVVLTDLILNPPTPKTSTWRRQPS